MFTYGSQVNPSLGRQDFSSILQGAQARAQGQIQAAQAQAQMYANIGSTIGNAIQTYTQKQEEKRQNEAGSKFISDWFKSNPSMAASFKLPLDEKGEPDKKAIGEVIKGLGGVPNAVKSFMAMSEFEQQNKARQQQEQAASYAALLRQGGGQVPSPVSNQALAQFSPQARMAGEAAFLQGERQRADIAETQAKTAALRGKPAQLGYGTFEEANKELNRLKKEGAFGEDTIGTVKFDNGRFVIESSVKPARQVPDEAATARMALTTENARNDITSGEAARRLIPNTNRMIGILEGGLDTGKLAKARSNLLAWGKAVGLDIDEDRLADAQQFEAYATQQIMGFISQTKGAISNKENELFQAMSAGLDRSPETNKRLLQASLDRLKLDAAIGDVTRRGIAANKSFEEIAKEREKLIAEYDAKLPDPASLTIRPAGGAMPSLTPLRSNRTGTQQIGRFNVQVVNP